MIGRVLRESRPEGMTDEELVGIMPVVDQITLTLQRIARRREYGQAKKLKI